MAAMSRRTEKQRLQREYEAFQREQDEQERVSAPEDCYDEWKQRQEYKRYCEQLEEQRFYEGLGREHPEFCTPADCALYDGYSY